MGCICGLAAWLTACSFGQPTPPPPAAASGSDWFVDRAAEAGLDFAYFNGMSGEFYFPEMMAGRRRALRLRQRRRSRRLLRAGADARRGPDGRAGAHPAGRAAAAARPALSATISQSRPTARATLHFTDVTEKSGIDARGYGMGVATGDFDNDGCVDLYLTNFGPNQLYRNNCDGTFTDVSQTSGVDDPGWSVSASFVDYDRDGWLDLYVGTLRRSTDRQDRPAVHRPDRPPRLLHAGVYTRADRSPLSQPAQRHVRGRDRDGAARRTLRAGARRRRPPISTATAGRTSTSPTTASRNLLWINQRNGTFKNTALLVGRGAERRRQGQAAAWASTPATSTTTATTISS